MPSKKSKKSKSKGKSSAAAQSAPSSPAVSSGSDSDSSMSDSSTIKLLILTEENYDLWIKRISDVFYGKGWMAVIAAAKHADVTTVASKTDFSDKHRGKAWSMLKCSLNSNVSKKVASVKD